MYSVDHLKALADSEQLDLLRTASYSFIDEYPNSEAGYLFLAHCQMRKQEYRESLANIERATFIQPNSDWAASLQFSILSEMGRVEEALDKYEAYLDAHPSEEVGKATYVQVASAHGYFERAGRMNEQRAVIRQKPSPRYAIALQTFIKADTLQSVFENLLQCRSADDFALVIIQDSAEHSKKQAEYEPLAGAVEQIILQYLPRLSNQLYSVEYIKNSTNLGTAPTCRRMLDSIAQRYDGFVFIEDDCLLSPAALLWTRHCLEKGLDGTGAWFATCESIFFDTQGASLSDTITDRLRQLEATYASKYAMLDFVPSTCFITTSQTWKKCANIRSFTRGPESLSAYVKSNSIHTLSPVVPYASDVGMDHPMGYSSQTLGADGVKEKKSTYVLASTMFEGEHLRDISLKEKELLYEATVQLSEAAASQLISLNQQ